MPSPAIHEAIRSSTRKGLGNHNHLKFSPNLTPYDIKRRERQEQLRKQKRPVFSRVPFLQKEKVAYIKLRRVGLSINQIAKAFGRSTSVVHRTLKRVLAYKTLRRFDMRKLPRRARVLSASFRWNKMLQLLPQWIAWICGEGERPP